LNLAMALAPEEVAHFIKKPPFFRVFLQPQRPNHRASGVEQFLWYKGA